MDPYFEKLPYKEKTVFGYVTLFDPRRVLKETVFTEQCGIPCMGLDEAEKIVLDYLIKGRYYACTGKRSNTTHVKSLDLSRERFITDRVNQYKYN